MSFYNPKKFNVFLKRGQKNFEFTGTCFFKLLKHGHFLDEYQILAGLSRGQKKQSSEFIEFTSKIHEISNLVIPSAFI